MKRFEKVHKFTALISIRNEATWITHCLKMIEPVVDEVVIGRGLKSWNNDYVTDDGTSEIIAQYLSGMREYSKPIHYFEMDEPKSDEWQRNQVLNKIREKVPDTDYVFVVDPDEFYHSFDLKKLFKFCDEYEPNELGAVHLYARQFFKNMRTLVGVEWFGPVMFGLRRDTHFSYIRNVDQDEQVTLDDVYLYHMTAVRTDQEMEEKIKGWSHSHEVVSNWLEEVWHGDKDHDIHPTSPGLWPSKTHISYENLPTVLHDHPYFGKDNINE